jgi:hypothetical protein
VLLDADPLADIRNTQRINAVITGGRIYRRPSLDEKPEVAEADARTNVARKLPDRDQFELQLGIIAGEVELLHHPAVLHRDIEMIALLLLPSLSLDRRPRFQQLSKPRRDDAAHRSIAAGAQLVVLSALGSTREERQSHHVARAATSRTASPP